MSRQVRRRYSVSIDVESLEGRITLSTARPTLAHGRVGLDLQGSMSGSSGRVVGNPDVGTAVIVHGSGLIAGQGNMQISGSFHGTGFIAQGGIEGSLRLATTKGSVTLQLQGPTVARFTAPISGTYRFTIQKGTGSLARDFGTGTIDVILGPTAFRMAFHGKPTVG